MRKASRGGGLDHSHRDTKQTRVPTDTSNRHSRYRARKGGVVSLLFRDATNVEFISLCDMLLEQVSVIVQ